MTGAPHTPSLRVEEEAADWVARCDGLLPGTDEEVIAAFSAADPAFARWVGTSVTHRVEFLRLYAAWCRADRLAALAPGERTSRRRGRRATARFAATACLLLAAFIVAFVGGLPGEPEVFRTTLGEQKTVTLADGTVVELNTDTRLTAELDADGRTIELGRGEAYFDVAHDEERPFTVRAGANRVTALGTAFNVRRNADSMKLVVADGQVKVENAADTARVQPVIARKGAMVHAGTDGALLSMAEEHEIAAALSWRRGLLVFDQMDLGSIAAEFNRYNRIKLVIADRDTAAVRIGGSFAASEVESFVRILEKDFGFDVMRQGNTFVVDDRD